MAFLPSLPEDVKLLDVFRAFPRTARPRTASGWTLLNP